MAAPAGFTNTTTAYVQLDSSYVRDHLVYIRKLKSKALPRKMKENFESNPSVPILQAEARTVVQSLIYDVYPDPGNRTNALLESFFVKSDSTTSTVGGLALFSDPSVASSKYYPDLSYAAFFEEPSFSTFIKPRGQVAPSNYRPFFKALEFLVKQRTSLMARKAVLDALLELMPARIHRK